MASTISLSNEMKEKLRNLGRAGESYEDVIRRMYEITKSNMLLRYLYDETGTMTIDEARRSINNGKSNNH